MNELLQKHGCSTVFSVPDGLKELVSDISREVLRAQPPNIYDFIANYLSALMITREHGVMAMSILDDLCDCQPTVLQHLMGEGFGNMQARQLAQIIVEEIEAFQPVDETERLKEYKILDRILKKVQLDEMTAAKVCQIARNAYRDYIYRRNSLKKTVSHPDEPWEIAAQRTLDLYKKTKPSLEEMSRAAEKIQAAYKGYYVRRNLLKHLQPKMKKKDRTLRLGRPSSDISGSRHIDYGPIINITVQEDNMKSVFEDSGEQPYYCQARYFETTERVAEPRCLATDPQIMTATVVYHRDRDAKETVKMEMEVGKEDMASYDVNIEHDEHGDAVEEPLDGSDKELVLESLESGVGALTTVVTPKVMNDQDVNEILKTEIEFDIDDLSDYELCDEELDELIREHGDASVKESLERDPSNIENGSRSLGVNPQTMILTPTHQVDEDIKEIEKKGSETEKESLPSHELSDEQNELIEDEGVLPVEEVLEDFADEEEKSYHSVSEAAGDVADSEETGSILEDLGEEEPLELEEVEAVGEDDQL